MLNSLLIILFTLLLSWTGTGPESRWVADGCGDLDSQAIAFLESETVDNTDLSHVAPELSLAFLLVLRTGFDRPDTESQSDTRHFPYSIRGPPVSTFPANT